MMMIMIMTIMMVTIIVVIMIITVMIMITITHIMILNHDINNEQHNSLEAHSWQEPMASAGPGPRVRGQPLVSHYSSNTSCLTHGFFKRGE